MPRRRVAVGIVLLMSATSCGSDDASPDGIGGAGSGGTRGADTAGAGGSSVSDVNSSSTGQACLDCDRSIAVPAGDVLLGQSDAGPDAEAGNVDYSVEKPEHAVFVPTFYLGKFEATVGRYRKFLAEYD